MCGIVGFFGIQVGKKAGLLESVVNRMADSLKSRGPDGHGVWNDGETVALGHRRLSILDLSQAGHQPMTCHTGRYVITFNGEIYNCNELKNELEECGAAPQWKGHSDTEVLLGGFVAWGVKSTLIKCVGMFALAVWDVKERSLTLARDRMGEKPLYYGWQGSGDERAFLFGSDLKALKVHPSFVGEIDRDSLSAFLRTNNVPTPRSIYKGISKLEAGHMLVLQREGMQCVKESYWNLVDAASIEGQRIGFSAFEESVTELEVLLKSAVRKQIVADVPVGAFLSGGIDSSLIVALMQSQSTNAVRTFTIGFHESGYDEALHAKAIARHLGTDHTEFYMTSEQALDVIPDLPNLYSEPFSDPSQIPSFFVSKLARQSVTVSLTGDGGDELFGGYDRYIMASNLLYLRKRIPGPLRKLLVGISRALPEGFAPGSASRSRLGDMIRELRKGHRFLTFANRKELYDSMMTQWPRSTDLVIGSLADYATDELERRLMAFEDLAYMMMKDLLSYLPDDILVKMDRAAMGVGLETRLPFLDHRVVEYAINLPLRFKFRNGVGKHILRQLLSKYLPVGLFERPKMGFNVPIGIWLRGPLREWAESLLDEARLKNEGFFHQRTIRSTWEQHINGTGEWPYQIWNVLMFQAWFESQKSTK